MDVPIHVDKLIHDAIEAEKQNLSNVISHGIWKHPELGFEEKYAHNLLTDFLESKGFTVHRHYHLPTAFRAEYGCLINPKYTVCVICEYDALPEIGHACGHNLIAEVGIAAAIAVKAAIDLHDVKGKLVVLGTPAEEGGGGKVILIEAGALKDVDCALMVHPGPFDVMDPLLLAIERITIQFFGKAAHASLAPWEGVNALDAAVLCYSSIAFGRQHMKPNCRIHGIISKGGAKANIVPSETELIFYVRASNKKNLERLKKSVFHSIEGAAEATGCSSKYIVQPHGYDSFKYNSPLQALYRSHAEKFGITYDERHKMSFNGSTDMGNISQVVPSIHPIYSIRTSAANHTKEFAEAAGSPEAQTPTLIAAKCIALTACQLFTNPTLQVEVRQAFKNNV